MAPRRWCHGEGVLSAPDRATSFARYIHEAALTSHGAVRVGSRGPPQQLHLAPELLFRTVQKDLPPFTTETEGLLRI